MPGRQDRTAVSHGRETRCWLAVPPRERNRRSRRPHAVAHQASYCTPRPNRLLWHGRPTRKFDWYVFVTSTVPRIIADFLVDYILSHPSTQASSVLIVPLPVLWDVLMNGLAPIWPTSRTAINGVPLGDAWPCQAMSTGGSSWETILPFHKVTQWLTYSIMQPMQSLLNMHFAGTELLTGLPEYRNGGLFVDLGVLNLKKEDVDRGLRNYADNCTRTGVKGVEVAPMFESSDDVIVEWRGVTVGLLDMLCVEVNKALRKELAGNELTLAQVLEAGSWKVRHEYLHVCEFELTSSRAVVKWQRSIGPTRKSLLS